MFVSLLIVSVSLCSLMLSAVSVVGGVGEFGEVTAVSQSHLQQVAAIHLYFPSRQPIEVYIINSSRFNTPSRQQ